ncbi:unnamed protein product [Rhizoctonia solani]|uniref:Zn(2)-C6 fungal-type domain-containing protein n=1 Tax=Rhizoctonia solani TaxID=456999 RepID=A0A8H3CZ91_9AGAM|nr:unnamed protein product [Rhizoctonia solani]
MPELIPKRSFTGCLTCKRRKKKCDEKRPQCNRCLLGGFDCLGYAHIEGYSSPSSTYKPADNGSAQLNTIIQPGLLGNESQSMTVDYLPNGTFLPLVNHSGTRMHFNRSPLFHIHKYSSTIPRSPQIGPFERDNMVDLIVSQYVRIAQRALFRPFPYAFNEAIAARARSSNIILKTMYLGARIAQALPNHINQHEYMDWIDIFQRQISGTQSTMIEVDAAHLADRLSAHQGLSFFAFMLSNSQTGYSLLRQGVPLFLQLAAKSPQVWTQDSAISISHALNPKRHEMSMFVLVDVILALAFGTPPLLNYDTTIHESEFGRGTYNFLEQVYSCPLILLILLARINLARIARLTNQRSLNPGDILKVEECVRSWSPTLDYTETPPESIARLAIQECWRLATLIYAYLGMCGADSADERVQPLVSQMAQLTDTIEVGSLFETHAYIPCLVAGVAARKEKHRAIFRRKIYASQNADACLLRGTGFVFVLDHLWHGAAVGGNPVTWEDYVNSRYATMPVDI